MTIRVAITAPVGGAKNSALKRTEHATAWRKNKSKSSARRRLMNEFACRCVVRYVTTHHLKGERQRQRITHQVIITFEAKTVFTKSNQEIMPSLRERSLTE